MIHDTAWKNEVFLDVYLGQISLSCHPVEAPTGCSVSDQGVLDLAGAQQDDVVSIALGHLSFSIFTSIQAPISVTGYLGVERLGRRPKGLDSNHQSSRYRQVHQ